MGRFEQMLAEIEHHVKKRYEEAGLGEPARALAERSLLITGRVPEVLIPVVQRLVGTTLDKIVGEMKEPRKVMFGGGNGAQSMGGAGYGDDGPRHQGGFPGSSNGLMGAEVGGIRVPWDVLRKVPLFGLKEIRKCTICGSVMEDLGLHRQGQQCQWVTTLQKACICGSAWVIIDI